MSGEPENATQEELRHALGKFAQVKHKDFLV